MSSNLLLILPGTALILTLIAAFSWRRLIWAVMFLLVCEGALRKFIPGLQAQLYLLKDAILICAYGKFAMSRGPSLPKNDVLAGLSIWFLLTLAYCIFEMINPN